MRIEQGLELMSSICSYLLNTQWKRIDDMIDKMNGILLVMSWVNFQRSNPCVIINGGVLVAFALSTVLSTEHQKPNIHLNMVIRHLLVVTFGMDIPAPRSPWQTIDTVYLNTLYIVASVTHSGRIKVFSILA
jgi:hypothetical protein